MSFVPRSLSLLAILVAISAIGCGETNSGPVTPKPTATPTSDAPPRGPEPVLAEEGP